MRQTRLVKIGDDYAILFDQEMLDAVDAKPSTPFQITTEGNVLVLQPTDSAVTPETSERTAQPNDGK